MLTELLRFSIRDRTGATAPVSDFCIALLDDDYPPVTHVIFESNGERCIEWQSVISFDARSKALIVEDFSSAQKNQDHDDVRLKRDIMDALLLDLVGRRTMRACDLRLNHEDDGSLRVLGADAGLRAMIRRVMGGRFVKPQRDSLFDWKYVEFLRGDPDAVDNGAGYRLRINRLPAGDIARMSDFIPYLHAAELLKLLPDDKAADVLQAMGLERQVQVIEELKENEAVGLLARMSPDLATDLLGQLELPAMRRYISELPAERREKILELLRYPSDSVGGAMVNDLLIAPVAMTAHEARDLISEQIKGTEFVSIVYVTDEEEDGLLKGSVSLRELAAAGRDTTLEELMDPFLQTLDPYDSASESAYRILSSQLEAMPVTNAQGRLLGAMTISAAISLLVPVAGPNRLRVFS